jgi:hypothetical protein
MRENRLSVASEALALPGDSPSVSTASEGRGPPHSAPNRTTGTPRDACDLCGSTCWDTAHFAVGKLWCEECWAGREPAVSMPPTPREQLLLATWIAPLNRGARP